MRFRPTLVVRKGGKSTGGCFSGFGFPPVAALETNETTMAQREIKYRVWDNEQVRMSKPYAIGSDHVLFSGDIPIPSGFVRGKSERFMWLEFTGLKDKNGKEICEGDIVQPVQYLKIDWLRGEVRFDSGMFYIHSKRHSGHPLHVSISQADRAANSYQIIGNIHENPELLK